MKEDTRPALLVILGPTASGKSEIAHAVALARGGEIVSADAFAVYQGLDAGTAKPSPEQRAEVPYHLVDVATPFESYSAGRWAREARSVVEDLGRRGKLPIVCGGSGFYISALLDGLPPGEARDERLRDALLGRAAAGSRAAFPGGERPRFRRPDRAREHPVQPSRPGNPALDGRARVRAKAARRGMDGVMASRQSGDPAGTRGSLC